MPAFQTQCSRHGGSVLDKGSYVHVKSKTVEVGLIKGRHQMPVEDYICEEIKNPSDWSEITDKGGSWVRWKLFCGNPYEYDEYHIHIYVTGLTAVLIAVLNEIRTVIRETGIKGVSVTLKHYDTVAEKYWDQKVVL